jgi:hypothetical protein
VTTLAQSVAADLAPLGPLADRAATYVLTGKSADVLGALEGHAGKLGLVMRAPTDSVARSHPHPRPVLSEFKQGDEAALERLGRVYAAASGRGVIDECAGDLRWVEQLLWEGGPNVPDTPGQGELVFPLELVGRRLRRAEPLVRAMLIASSDNVASARNAFASNALGAPDVASFVVRNKGAVVRVLDEGNLESVERLEKANVPVALFAETVAELAVKPRLVLRQAAVKWLAHDTAVAGTESASGPK